MQRKSLMFDWLVWEFYEMPKLLLLAWNNYFLFATNFFSVGVLFKTFFSPWRKYNWRYPSILNAGEFFGTLISNVFSRLIGAVMRLVLIVMGIIFQVFVAVSGLVIFIGWFLIPIIIILGIYVSI